jgi:ribosomal protein L15E
MPSVAMEARRSVRLGRGVRGRRVLVSRKWSGKTLTDHRADRKAWLMAILDMSTAEDDSTHRWEVVIPTDPDHMPPVQRLMHVLADRTAWQTALVAARRKADEQASDLWASDARAA